MSQPYLRDADVTLYHGDVLDVLRELEPESVDCVVTSPPYWGLRDYGTGAWEGGDEGCDHAAAKRKTRYDYSLTSSPIQDGTRTGTDAQGGALFGDVCPDCGATRIDQQLGLEPTPEQYVSRMVEVFREVRRVLASHGTVWLNLGDSYAAAGGHTQTDAELEAEQAKGWFGDERGRYPTRATKSGRAANTAVSGLKQKDLCGIPWRVAFALQADGWYLRSDIIWSKPNPMPESVTDRPTKAHEYVFLLSKQPRYFFDQEAVREGFSDNTHSKGRGIGIKQGVHENGGGLEAGRNNRSFNEGIQRPASDFYSGRNIRSVWEIATQPYPEAHFATFPEELARRCIAAGCPEQVCRVCGKARERVLETWHQPVKYPGGIETPVGEPVRSHKNEPHAQAIGGPQSWEHGRARRIDKTVGFTDCGHSDYRPGIVLDPFMGSGTVAYVARKLGRHSIGIDLSAEYLKLAARRLQQQSLFANA